MKGKSMVGVSMATVIKMAPERRKKPFFSDEEKRILLSLVEANRSILECRKTDYSSTKRKQIAWDELALDFNSQYGVMIRTAKQLKKCWTNTKAKAKKKEMARESEQLRNGSEKETIIKTCDESLSAMDIIVPTQIHHAPDECGDSHGFPLPVVSIRLIKDLPETLGKLDSSRVSDEDDAPQGKSRGSHNETTTPAAPHSSQDRNCSAANQAKYIRLMEAQKTLMRFEEKEHQLALQILQEKRAFQLRKHERQMQILNLKEENERRVYETFKLKEENELRHKKILEVQKVFWEENLRNMLQVSDDNN